MPGESREIPTQTPQQEVIVAEKVKNVDPVPPATDITVAKVVEDANKCPEGIEIHEDNKIKAVYNNNGYIYAVVGKKYSGGNEFERIGIQSNDLKDKGVKIVGNIYTNNHELQKGVTVGSSKFIMEPVTFNFDLTSGKCYKMLQVANDVNDFTTAPESINIEDSLFSKKT